MTSNTARTTADLTAAARPVSATIAYTEVWVDGDAYLLVCHDNIVGTYNNEADAVAAWEKRIGREAAKEEAAKAAALAAMDATDETQGPDPRRGERSDDTAWTPAPPAGGQTAQQHANAARNAAGRAYTACRDAEKARAAANTARTAEEAHSHMCIAVDAALDARNAAAAAMEHADKAEAVMQQLADAATHDATLARLADEAEQASYRARSAAGDAALDAHLAERHAGWARSNAEYVRGLEESRRAQAAAEAAALHAAVKVAQEAEAEAADDLRLAAAVYGEQPSTAAVAALLAAADAYATAATNAQDARLRAARLVE